MQFENYILSEERLKELIEILQQAHSVGFSLSSSFPAEPLLELMIDSSLQLSNQAREEGPWTEVQNPSLEFLEKPLKLRSGAKSGIWATERDELGNVAQKQRNQAPDTMTDPKLPDFFKKLATTLVEIKRLHHLPPHLYCEEGSKRRDQPAKKISPETFWYLKRRKNRLKKHNTHHYRKG